VLAGPRLALTWHGSSRERVAFTQLCPPSRESTHLNRSSRPPSRRRHSSGHRISTGCQRASLSCGRGIGSDA